MSISRFASGLQLDDEEEAEMGCREERTKLENRIASLQEALRQAEGQLMTYQQAWEDILTADDTSTAAGAVAIVRAALDTTDLLARIRAIREGR